MNLGMAFQKNMVFPASTHSSNNLHVYSPPKKKTHMEAQFMQVSVQMSFSNLQKKNDAKISG